MLKFLSLDDKNMSESSLPFYKCSLTSCFALGLMGVEKFNLPNNTVQPSDPVPGCPCSSTRGASKN